MSTNSTGVSLVSSTDRSFTIGTGLFSATYEPEDGAIHLSGDGNGYLSLAPGRDTAQFDVLDPNAVDEVSVVENDGVTARISGSVEVGDYEFDVSFPEPGLLTYELAIVPPESGEIDETIFDEPTAGLSFHGGESTDETDLRSYLDGTPDSDPAAGTSDLNQFVFCGAPSSLDATILYQVDFTALSPFYRQTGTNMRGTVSSPPGRFGYDVPRPNSDLAAGERIVVDKAAVHISPDVVPIDEPVEYCRRFVDGLAAIYPHIEKPAGERIDWREISELTARDIDRPENTFRYRGRTHPGGVELVTVMSILVPYAVYGDAFEGELPAVIAGDAEETVAAYYDSEYGIGSERSGLIANSPSPHSLTHVDAWYFFWPIVQVGEYAAAIGSDRLAGMVLDSAETAIELGQALDYVFPMWLNVEEREGYATSRESYSGYQYDCTGAYVYLMVQCHEFAGEERYLQEARTAADRLLGMGFELPYEFTTSALVPLALLRLAELTGEDRYREGSYVGLANVLRHSYFFDPDYGVYEDRFLFLLTEAMPPSGYSGNFFANGLEEGALIYYLVRYLDAGRDSLAPAAKQLTAELLRHKGTSLQDSLAPLQPDPSRVYDGLSPQSGRRVHRDWYLPLEPFGMLEPMFSSLGEVGQDLYGAGAYPAMADVQYHRLDETTLYAASPVRCERIDEFTHRVEPLAAEGAFEARLLGEVEPMLTRSVRTDDGEKVPMEYDSEEDCYRFRMRADRTYTLRTEVPDRAVIVEDLSVDSTTVEPGEEVTVDISVVNTGTVIGWHAVEVSVGRETHTEPMILYPGETQRATVTFSIDRPGVYSVSARHRRRSLEVRGESD